MGCIGPVIARQVGGEMAVKWIARLRFWCRSRDVSVICRYVLCWPGMLAEPPHRRPRHARGRVCCDHFCSGRIGREVPREEVWIGPAGPGSVGCAARAAADRVTDAGSQPRNADRGTGMELNSGCGLFIQGPPARWMGWVGFPS